VDDGGTRSDPRGTSAASGRLSPVPDRPSVDRSSRLVPWLLRATWIGVVLVGMAAIDSAVADQPDAIGDAARIAGGAAWVIGVAAMAIPAVVSLTATRVVVPLAVPAAIGTTIAGAEALESGAFVALAALSTVIACSAELGRTFVQASAYGDEHRLPLRPPLAYLLACVVTWLAWAAAVLAAPLLLADRRWVLGSATCAVAVAGLVWAWPRWHKLSRRWFVLVPTGVVIHDHLVLAETVMVRRNEVVGLRLAPADTEALDLTGPATGHAVELTTNGATTAILAATPTTPRGTAVHFSACLLSPSRPGRLLTAARSRRLPVG
jgi:hypothetical protein